MSNAKHQMAILCAALSLPAVSIHAQTVRQVGTEVDAHGTHWFRTSPSSHQIPEGAPGLAIHVTKAAKRERGVHLVVYLHGWRGCPRVLLSSERVACKEGGRLEEPFALRDAAEEADLPMVFVVPQLSFWKRSGAAGKYRDPAYVRSWFESLRSTAPLSNRRVLSTTLVAHSAGFETALSILAGAPDAVEQVVMLDALYDGGAVLARWVLGAHDRRALTLTLHHGDTFKQSKLSERLVRKRLGDGAVGRPTLDAWAEGVRFKNMRASTQHRDIPRKQLAEILRLLIR